MIKTFDEAYEFVLAKKVCTVFGSKGSPYPLIVGQHGTVGKETQGGKLKSQGCCRLGLEDTNTANLSRLSVLWKGSGG